MVLHRVSRCATNFSPLRTTRGDSMKKIVRLLVAVLALSTLSAVAAVPAKALASLDETFTGSTLLNPNNWVMTYSHGTTDPSSPPCLTAASSSTTITLAEATSISGCASTPTDTPGSGALLLTNSYKNQSSSMLYNSALPTNAGLDISFYQAQYGPDNADPADGISFYLKDGSATGTTAGAFGYGLGYIGIPKALFGIGFDVYGNFSSRWDSRLTTKTQSCTNSGPGAPFSATYKNSIVLRGPDTSGSKDGSSGYCYLAGQTLGADYFGNSTTSRIQAGKPVRIVVDPTTDASPKIRVYTWASGAPNQDISTAQSFIVDQPAEYKAATTFKFGFAASTGGAYQQHAIWGLNIAPVTEVPLTTVYIVPNNVSVTGGNTATYTYSVRTNASDPATAISTTNLTNFNPGCTSSYTTMTSGPTTLPISCSGASIAFYKVDSSATATLTVAKGAARLAPSATTITGRAGTAITPTAGYTSADFNSAPTYSISPALPTGLTLNTSTGVISGTPVNALSTASYVLTATSGSQTASTSVSVTIAANPALSPATQTVVARSGVAISPTTALTATGYAGSVTYSVSPALPAGFTLNASTGVVSGTASGALSATDYTITGTDGTNTSTVKVTISAGAAVSLTPTGQTINAKVGTAITATTAYTTNNFGAGVVYSISPALPSGLTINTTTGVVTGTPSAVLASTVYVVTATQGSDTARADITLIVTAAPTLTPATQTINGKEASTIASSAALTAASFTRAVTYTINPALPNGLALDATTGVISGKPVAALASTVYTITATDGTYSATSAVTILVKALTTISPVTQSLEAKVGTAVTPSTAFTPKNFVGAVTYSISPALPAGLLFSTFTGVITGTPTVAIATTVETITATDGVDSATATITISSRLVPLISPTGFVVSGTLNKAITASTAMESKYFTGTLKYSITPAIPAGLKIDATTGVISGTPTALSPIATYTISGADGVDTATATVQIVVGESAITYAVTYLPNGGTGNMTADNGTGTSIKLSANQYSRTGYNFAGWKDAAGNVYTDSQILAITANTTLALTAQWSAIGVNNNTKAGQPDVITLMDPGSGLVGTPIVITGKFSLKVTDIQWNGTSLPAGSWTQTPTTISFNSVQADPNSVSTIQLINGATPLLSQLSFKTIPAELPPPAPLINFPKYLISDGVVGFDGVKLILAFSFGKATATTSHIAALKKYMVKLNKTVTLVGYAQAVGKKPDLKYANLRAKAITAAIKKIYPKAKIKAKASAVKKNKECGDFSNKCVVIIAK